MKDNELQFDRTCHVLYSKPCKNEIQKKIALHYPPEKREAVWEQVQKQYVTFLSDWRTDLGGKKNFHNGKGGTYDCIAIMSYYIVCRDVASFREIEEIEENLILPSFRKLKFVDCNRPFWKKLMYKAFTRAKAGCDEWHDYEMHVAPYDKGKPIYYEFTACPAAEFAKKYGLEEIMPALCNVDYASMELIHAKLKLRRIEPNAPEELVFPHIAALFGTLTSVWLRPRSTTLHEKTSPSGAKQFLKSKFLLRQGKKASNADALRGFLTQYRRKFAFKNRMVSEVLQPTEKQITAFRKGKTDMRILVFGAGVLGCNLAKDLFCAGKDVTLLARGNWAKEIQENGLRIKNVLSLGTSVSRVPTVTELDPDNAYDVIFAVVRYTQIEAILDTLRANKTKNIVFVGNNVRAAELAALLPEKNVLFGFASSAGHRESNRVVSANLHKITIGQLDGAPSNEKLIGQIFEGTKYKITYEPNMGDYLLCHAAFIVPVVFACYKTDGNLKKLRKNDAYLNRMIDANIEGYRAIKNAGHQILPKSDENFEGAEYRKTCFRFFKLMCATFLGKICASDHAMNAVDEMSALNRDMKQFFDENKAEYPVWLELEKECGRYFK